MKAEEWIKLRNSEWYDNIKDMEEIRQYHKRNVERIKNAISHYEKKDRPLKILAIFGSGRNIHQSCAHEESNSKLLLKTGLEAVRSEDDIEIDEVELRQYQIEPCNGCVSTSSAWCHMPCTCFPLDGMQDLYPKVLSSDVLLFSTGVYQSLPHGRLADFLQRLISLDGGLYIAPEQWQPKTEEFKRKALTLAASGDFSYSPRLAGRVAAYFITSKDAKNSANVSDDPGYESLITGALYSGNSDYGMVHADPWYVFAGADHPNRDYQYDKADYNNQEELFYKAVEVVRAAVDRAWIIRKEGYTPPIDRRNRT